MSNDSGYSEQEDVQNMIDRAVERDGPTYVRENIDRLLGGINVVMSVDKDELEIPTALDAALARWDPSTGIDPAMTRAQTRRAAEYLAATGDRLGRTGLVDALADGSTLDTATWWGRAVDPGLRYLTEEGLVAYRPVDDTYRWVGDNR
ncbi:hypothetical protein [Halorubrum laminariae]|uniref:Uncharacterized protein n=1 Tax=Halorubrum laminariae TaxID=1433523 RepID=A0ABD6C4Y9_9EURY|nr:hypothetical protein [Halorubrum laminariae]